MTGITLENQWAQIHAPCITLIYGSDKQTNDNAIDKLALEKNYGNINQCKVIKVVGLWVNSSWSIKLIHNQGIAIYFHYWNTQAFPNDQ